DICIAKSKSIESRRRVLRYQLRTNSSEASTLKPVYFCGRYLPSELYHRDSKITELAQGCCLSSIVRIPGGTQTTLELRGRRRVWNLGPERKRSKLGSRRSSMSTSPPRSTIFSSQSRTCCFSPSP